MKTENQRFFDIFRGYKKETFAVNGSRNFFIFTTLLTVPSPDVMKENLEPFFSYVILVKISPWQAKLL